MKMQMTLTKEAFNKAGVNDGVSQAYTDRQSTHLLMK